MPRCPPRTGGTAGPARCRPARTTGLLRLRYLEKSDPDQLNILLLEGALNSHLAQIDRQVRGQVEQTMERLVQRTKLPDKQTDPLGWAGTMNSLRQQAEETAMELIYGS